MRKKYQSKKLQNEMKCIHYVCLPNAQNDLIQFPGQRKSGLNIMK